MLTPVRGADAQDGIVLRLARGADLTSLIELDHRCFGPRAWPTRGWWEVISEPVWTTVVGTSGGALVAASVLQLDRPVTSLASIAVDPTWRNRGLGAALLRDAVARARAVSARLVTLEVDVENRAARKLYAEAGFGLSRRFLEGTEWRVELVRRLRRTPPRLSSPLVGRARAAQPP